MVTGLFLPNTEGPWHRPGSFGAALVGSPIHQTSYQKGTEISPSPKSEGPAVLNSCWSPLGHGCSPWVSRIVPRPASQTPGCPSGQGPQRALITMLSCQAALHAT